MSGGDGGAGASRELDQTPTWAVASVCAVIILVSILLEKGLHHIGEWLTKRRKKPLFEALEKVKAELMILGFISLLMTFGQNYISRICISKEAADIMLPCSLEKETLSMHVNRNQSENHHCQLLSSAIVDLSSNHRALLANPSGSSCPTGKVSLVSINGLHQLHIFIFFLAVFHVVYSAITMALGRAKIRGWKEWEREASSSDYEFFNDFREIYRIYELLGPDPSRFRFSYEATFVKQHTSCWTKIPISFYAVSFFRQFLRSIQKADYLTLRHGFIAAHLAPHSKFDFQKYIKRSLEDDFKVVVGISPVLWAFALIFLLLNIHGWQSLFWTSIIPLLIILAVGTKLQAIITRMALDIQETNSVIQGIPLVQLTDHYFWFERPQLVLFLIHFSLFQNAFQIIYFLWIWYEFGLKSCFHKNFNLIIARVCTGMAVQFLCSYITLPLYALVSQMGSQMKKSIFDEQTSKALKKWHQAVKKKQAKTSANPSSMSPARSPECESPKATQMHQLHQFKTTGHAGLSAAPSRRRFHPEQCVSDTEADATSSAAVVLSCITTDGPYNRDLLTGTDKLPLHVEDGEDEK